MTKIQEIKFQDVNSVKDIKPSQAEQSVFFENRAGVLKPNRIIRDTDEIDMLPTLKINRKDGITGGIKRVTSTYNANGSEFLISCNADGGALDVNLPDLGFGLAKTIRITETGGTNLVTVKDSGGTTIAQCLKGSFNFVECLWNGEYWEKAQ